MMPVHVNVQPHGVNEFKIKTDSDYERKSED